MLLQREVAQHGVCRGEERGAGGFGEVGRDEEVAVAVEGGELFGGEVAGGNAAARAALCGFGRDA